MIFVLSFLGVQKFMIINFQIISNFYNVAVTLFEDSIDKQAEIIESIFNIFHSYSKIIRVGYIVTRFSAEEDIKIVKDKYFKEKEFNKI